jgi:plasmid stability protein
MATMTIKNVPDELYQQLKQSAERHRRSINSEVIVCLERALGSERVDPDVLLMRARSLRARTPDLFVTDAELRTARDEGRP